MITGLYFAAINNVGFFYYANAKAGNIIVVTMIHTRHFGSFTTHQSATRLHTTFSNTGNHCRRSINVKFACSIVIQEKQRFGSLNYQIVYAHGN